MHNCQTLFTIVVFKYSTAEKSELTQCSARVPEVLLGYFWTDLYIYARIWTKLSSFILHGNKARQLWNLWACTCGSQIMLLWNVPCRPRLQCLLCAGKIFPAHFCPHPRKIYKIKLIRANIKPYPSKMNGVNLISVKCIVIFRLVKFLCCIVIQVELSPML
jgi:hypothetical protein